MASAADKTDVPKPTSTEEHQQAEVNVGVVGVKGAAAFFEKKIAEQSEEYKAAELEKKKKEAEARKRRIAFQEKTNFFEKGGSGAS